METAETSSMSFSIVTSPDADHADSASFRATTNSEYTASIAAHTISSA
jgi:hypothetical protein